ncbi:TetR/AcrR family transcriptional regulator [Actinomadura viridis]|uniref:TetR/AcrR family transcriptional regulator n=1 Tax=Actinomadura viridis TaxID=58110 RepID=UPI0027DBB205|nr:TetR/AcrR family transcriptional regulator [Actinomadura viridis]
MVNETVISEELRSAILKCALEVCRAEGYPNVSMAAIAARAGVTEELLATRWPSRSALLIDAFRREIGAEFLLADSGDFHADLRSQLTAVAKVFTDPSISPHLTALIAEMQHDPEVSGTFGERVFGPNRFMARARFESARKSGQIRDDIDIDTAIDLTFAPLWFRLLLPTGPITPDYAAEVADLSVAALGRS